jgi:CBS domain-containing protein
VSVAAILNGASNRRQVETISPEDTVREAVRRLNGPPRIGSLVVCRPGERRVVGLISERDIVRGLGRHRGHLLDMRVSEVMSRNVPVCGPDDTISFAMREMTRTRYRHLPVVENGELVGLISIGDVVKSRLRDMELEAAVLRDLYAARR